MNRRLALVLVIAIAGVGGVGSSQATATTPASPTAIAHSCSAGWVHGIIGGQHKCLRAGQFCARRYDRQYHRYGFHCHKYDSRARRYRLTR